MVILLVLLVFTISLQAHENGTHRISSNADVDTTMSRIKQLVEEKSMKVFAIVNHAKGASGVGQELRPTQLIIFGNPKGGTPLMQCNQQVGLDLPLKMMVWQDEKNQVWISYNEPSYIAKRYDLKQCGEKVIKNMTDFLELVSFKASK